MSWINTQGYEVAQDGDREVYVHRQVWEARNGPLPEGMHIDHVNGDKADNRIENLRLATHAQNMQNRRKAQRNNRSTGLLGASFHKASGRYHAAIQVAGKSKSLGYHKTAEDAHAAYLRAKRELHEFCTI